MTLPLIFDLEGLELSADERAFFKDADPYGYIIFGRNIENPEQLRALTDSLRELSSNDDVPILIDQEGGRVVRMKPPHWPQFLSAQALIEQGGGDAEATKKIIYDNARRLGEVLGQVGINVNCAPVVDIPVNGSDPIIGDRAYGSEPMGVAMYARAMSQGLSDSGVMPVLKHIPGHGRATVDSHLSLPVVDTPLDVLEATDFEAFKQLRDLPYAMTAHIVYEVLDKVDCATFSREVIRYIREDIGFNGVLMSDAVNMEALSGSYIERTQKALNAGCDLVLYCNGNDNTSIEEKTEVAAAVPQTSEQTMVLTKQMFQQTTATQTAEFV